MHSHIQYNAIILSAFWASAYTCIYARKYILAKDVREPQ